MSLTTGTASNINITVWIYKIIYQLRQYKIFYLLGDENG